MSRAREMRLERAAELGGKSAVGAAVVLRAVMRLHVRLEHRLVDAAVVAARAAEAFDAVVVVHVVLEVVAQRRDELAHVATQLAFEGNVNELVLPQRILICRFKVTDFTDETFSFRSRRHRRSRQHSTSSFVC